MFFSFALWGAKIRLYLEIASLSVSVLSFGTPQGGQLGCGFAESGLSPRWRLGTAATIL